MFQAKCNFYANFVFVFSSKYIHKLLLPLDERLTKAIS